MNALETGNRIQQLRKSCGWTQKDLAQKLNVTDRAVSKWERGLNYPDMAILEPLAKALGTTVAELLCIENVPDTEKVEAVTVVAAEETERLRKETRERATFGVVMTVLIFAALYMLGHQLIEREVYGLPLNLCNATLSLAGFHFGNYLWIWLKYRK